MLIHGRIPVDPIGKGRPRFFGGRAVTPEKTRTWEDDVGFLVRGLIRRNFPAIETPLGGPLRIGMMFCVNRPASHLKKTGEPRSSAPTFHTGKPDVDNMAKAFLDAIQKAGIIKDDAQVVSISADKAWWSSPSISFRIEEATQEGGHDATQTA